jgi:hypothetical protein
MPERGNDRLESFFKKVSSRPDISYQEEDWKKLEARLEAKEIRSSAARKSRSRIAGASAVAVLLVGGLYWLSQPSLKNTSIASTENIERSVSAPKIMDDEPMPIVEDLATQKDSNSTVSTRASKASLESLAASNRAIKTEKNDTYNRTAIKEDFLKRDEASGQNSVVNAIDGPDEAHQTDVDKRSTDRLVETLVPATLIDDIYGNSTSDDIKISPATADKIKQKANTADSVLREENGVKVIDAYGSGLTEHPASPRLSLLLSIAPDFSTVAFDYYTDPGQSFGLMVNYHIKRSWSFSAGVVKSFKKYVGDGEDYTPPSGYWRNNTNGIIPETVNGSCNILEIPIMVQYTVANKGKNRFLVGAGASSYIMLNEAYKYNFEQPNPGAKKGWSSQKNSALFFNVINVTAGFEHRIFPGFMMGIEPYLKIPIEGIGWSDLKLYSVGASFTLRYIILNQKNSAVAVPGHGAN